MEVSVSHSQSILSHESLQSRVGQTDHHSDLKSTAAAARLCWTRLAIVSSQHLSCEGSRIWHSQKQLPDMPVRSEYSSEGGPDPVVVLSLHSVFRLLFTPQRPRKTRFQNLIPARLLTLSLSNFLSWWTAVYS